MITDQIEHTVTGIGDFQNLLTSKKRYNVFYNETKLRCSKQNKCALIFNEILFSSL